MSTIDLVASGPYPVAREEGAGQERGRGAALPGLHGQDRGPVLLHVRRPRRLRRNRPDQPDLAVRPVQPGDLLQHLAARLVHLLPRGSAAPDARLKTDSAGHTIMWNIFVPGVVLVIAFFLIMGGYPFFEQWATGD